MTITKNDIDEGNRRKQRSLEILKKEFVPYLEYLAPYGEGKYRLKKEICIRAICLMLVAVRAEGLEKEIVLKIVQEFGVGKDFSPEEYEFLSKDNFDFKDKVKFLWRYESLVVLLWVLGYITKLERPEDICNVESVVSIICDRGRERFIDESKLKPFNQVLDEADLIFRYHWAVRNENLKGNPSPANLDASIIYERRYSLEWILNKNNDHWDEVDTST